MSVTDYYEAKILDHMLRAAAFTPPATVYVALFTVAPSDAGGGTEVSGGGYARQAVTFGAPSAGAMSNSAAVTFPQATTDWGTVTHVALMDASTAGNMLWWGALTASRSVTTGTIFEFPIGDLDVTLD